VKGDDRGYKIVDVAAVKFRYGSIILVEKMIFDVTYEKIGVARPIATPLTCL